MIGRWLAILWFGLTRRKVEPRGISLDEFHKRIAAEEDLRARTEGRE